MHDHRPAYRTIVVGHDGTPQADDAVALALQLLDRSDGRLVLANVFPFYRGWALSAATPGAMATVLQERAETLLERVAESLPSDVERSLFAYSDSSVARGLHDIAETEHADLIVLGSSHHGAAGRLAGRTTVRRLLHAAPCAVAVAAPDRRTAPLRRIAVVDDGSPEAGAALDAAYALADRCGAALEPLRAVGDGDGDGADLIVCGARASGPLRRVATGTAHPRVPVLVVPRPIPAVPRADGTPSHLEEAR